MPSEEWMGVEEYMGRLEARIEALERRQVKILPDGAVAGTLDERKIRELYEWALPGVVAACNPRCVADRMEKLWPWLADTERG